MILKFNGKSISKNGPKLNMPFFYAKALNKTNLSYNSFGTMHAFTMLTCIIINLQEYV
jgi:hypothetical protein